MYILYVLLAYASVVTSAVVYDTDVIHSTGDDYGIVIDEILEETYDKIPASVSFTQLHYKQKSWDAADEHFNVVARLDAVNGHLKLDRFGRLGDPQVWGADDDKTLGTTITVGLSITYDNFTAENLTSGETASGQMSVRYHEAEIYTTISIKRDSPSCTSSVQSFTPTKLSDPSATINSTVSDLPYKLFSLAEPDLNFFLNQTLVTEGLPTFAGVVAGTDLCSISS